MIEMAETTPIEILINLRFQPQGITETTQALDEVLSRINRLRQAGVPISTVTSGLGQVRNEATRTAQAMQQASSSGMIFYRSIGALGLIVPMTSQQLNAFEQAVNATKLAMQGGKQELETAKVKTAEFARTMGIAENVAGEWVLTCARMQTKARELGTTMRRIPIGFLEERFRRTRAFMRAFTGALGRFGFTFFRVGYQVYWASIGLIFYVLSLRRARYEQVRMERTALSMVQAYYRMKEAEEDLREIIKEHGPASREAQRAARQLAIMRIRQRIVEEQLRASIEQAVIAEKSAFLTLIPIMINVGAVFSNAVAAILAYISTSMASASATATDTAAKTANIAVSNVGIIQRIKEAISHITNTSAINAETIATWALVAAKTALISLGPPLIGMAIGWALAQWQAAQVQEEVNRRMAEMREQMRSMKEEVERLTNSYLSMSGSAKEVITSSEQLSKVMDVLEEKMTGGSVYDSVLAVNSALNTLSRSLREVRDIRLQYSISIEGIQEARNQIESLELPQRRTNLEVTQQIRQVLIPANIPRIRDQIQNIRQIVIPARIPIIQDTTQYIKQEVQLAEIPEIEDKVQRIRQIAVLARIPEIEDQTQLIRQILERVEIPAVEEQEQYIRQTLIPVSIPRVQNQIQFIFQRLIRTEIPEVDNQIQFIEQRLLSTEIPEIEEKEQVIRQRLVPVEIPSIQDQVQYIRQEVTLAHIPDIQDKVQYIRQELIPVSIPRIEDQRQRILQEIEVLTRVPELVRRNVEVEIDVPSRIVKRVDLDIETRIGREIRRTVERPSGNVINLSIGQIQVQSKEELKEVLRNVYYSLQRNVREISLV